jgi:hypothetical protein
MCGAGARGASAQESSSTKSDERGDEEGDGTTRASKPSSAVGRTCHAQPRDYKEEQPVG